MRLETALNKQRDAVARLSSLYSTAKICGMTSADVNAEFSAILAGTGKAPRWVRAYLEGRRDALSDALYADSLMFGGYLDGVFYSTHSARPDYYGKHGIDPAQWAERGRVERVGHYWKTTQTPRPFFV